MLCRAIEIPELEKAIRLELKNIKPIVPESMHTTFFTEGLSNFVKCIQICEIENVQETENVEPMVMVVSNLIKKCLCFKPFIIKNNLQTGVDSLDLDTYLIKIYFYKLDDSGLVDDTSAEETTCKMRRCILPNVDFCGIWESLVFQEPVKEIVIVQNNNMYLTCINS